MPQSKTQKKSVKPKKKSVKSYVIEDSTFGQFTIKYSDNPWWKDKDKVAKLIQGFKMDCKPSELRILAGITEDQLRYFLEQHEELSRVFEDLRKTPTLKARMTIIQAIGKDANHAFRYLERKEPEEFQEKKTIEVTKPSLVQDMFPLDDEETK